MFKMTTLEMNFKFNLPDDESDYKTIQLASKFRNVLWDFYTQLRSKVKYSDEIGNFEEAYSLFWDVMKENDLELDDLL